MECILKACERVRVGLGLTVGQAEAHRVDQEEAVEAVEVVKKKDPYVGSLRWKVFQTFENPDYRDGPWPKMTAKVISLIVMATILMSTVAFILESEACSPTSWLPGKPFTRGLHP